MASSQFIIFKAMRNLFLILFFSLFVFQAYSEDSIFRIDIKGNKIVSDSKIISKIKTRAGQSYNENIINTDIKNLYATGFFETVEAEKKDVPEGIVIIFKVKEKAVLKKVSIEGARYIRAKKILESIDVKKGSFIDEYKMKEAVRKIKDLYNVKGYSQAEVKHELIADENEVTARFVINEKGILKVRSVVIMGNELIPASKILKVMKAKKAWLFNRGVFKEDVLRDDIKRIGDFYRLKGFVDIQADIDIDFQPDGVYLVVNINEGRCYRIGRIEVEGNKNIYLTEIVKVMLLKKGSAFSEYALYIDSSRIREIYVDKGYIFSQVEPLSFFNSQTEKVDIVYKISESEVAYIENIDIIGNIKTKDKIIRRELRVYPGDKFDGKKVKKSKERLDNLGFFEEIRFGTEPGDKINNVDLVVDVKEAKTGYISFGGGYSSVDEFIGFIELRQRNFDYKNFSTFTGAGQDLSLMTSIGTMTDRYQLSFTNPGVFDSSFSFGFDAYKKGHKQDDDVGYAYEEDIKGGALRLGREFSDHLAGRAAYRFERVEIGDIVDDASADLKKEEGTNDLISGEFSLSFDNRDNIFSPSKGIYSLNTFQVTGGILGGDKNFLKYFSRLSFYFPTVKKSVVELRLRVGFAEPFSDTDEIPIYERFFAGGSSTIRGYHERKIGPVDNVTGDPLGGEAMFIGNIEYTYPLANFLKVATFFDTGDVWKKNSDFLEGGLMSSVGLGLRVKTPIGPICVDYGWPLDAEPGEDSKEGRFHFNISRGF